MYVFFQLLNESPRGFKFFAVIHFNFQSSKEIFHYTIIHTVSFSGHALYNVVFSKKPLVWYLQFHVVCAKLFVSMVPFFIDNPPFVVLEFDWQVFPIIPQTEDFSHRLTSF